MADSGAVEATAEKGTSGNGVPAHGAQAAHFLLTDPSAKPDAIEVETEGTAGLPTSAPVPNVSPDVAAPIPPAGSLPADPAAGSNGAGGSPIVAEKTEPEAESEVTEPLAAEPEAAESAGEPEAAAEPEAGAEPDPEPEADAAAGSEATTEPEADAEPEAAAELLREPEAAAEPASESDPEPEPEPADGTDAQTEPSTDAEPEPEPAAATDAGAAGPVTPVTVTAVVVEPQPVEAEPVEAQPVEAEPVEAQDEPEPAYYQPEPLDHEPEPGEYLEGEFTAPHPGTVAVRPGQLVVPYPLALREQIAARHRRQTGTFLGLFLIVIVVGLLGFTNYIGWWAWPFSHTAASSQLCPTPTPTAAPINQTGVRIYNASNRRGLAGSVTKQFQRRGFAVPVFGNDPNSEKINGAALVRYGPNGALQARTVWAQLNGKVLLVTDNRTESTVDLVLGPGFKSLRTPAQAAKLLVTPPVDTSNCTPASS